MINEIQNFPSINSDYMISKQGFEFALEEAKFLENFRKNREEEKSCEVFL